MQFILIGLLQFLLGSAFFVVSVSLGIRKILRLKKWTQTKGFVTDIEISKGMHQSYGTPRTTLYKPRVRYQIADGRTIDYEPKTSNSWSNYSVGQQIPVYYDPQQPEKAMVGTNFGQWFGLIVFSVVGGFLALFGLIFIAVSVNFRH